MLRRNSNCYSLTPSVKRLILGTRTYSKPAAVNEEITKIVKNSPLGIRPKSPATAPAILFPVPFARNQPAINTDANRAGATFVTYDKPTGERQSSPVV